MAGRRPADRPPANRKFDTFARECTLYCKATGLAGMTDLDKALDDIIAIRSQIARCVEFRGYGPVTVAATGALAVLAAAVQALWLPDPVSELASYLALWVMTAGLSVVLIGSEMVTRSRRIHSGLADAMIP